MQGQVAEGRAVDASAAADAVVTAIDRERDALVALAKYIHANPEIAMQEHLASAACAEFLEERGFTVARGIAGLPTAFQAEAGSGRPAVAFLAEYDALPGLGHGCGHNLIALTAVGAGVGLRAALDGVLGTALVFGAPAEEACNGKAIMAEAGIFAGLDAAIGAHPGPGDAAIPTVDGSGVIHAAQGVQIAFRGKPAHAAADPYHGINALNALIETFNGINALRQHIRSDARIHGIVTHGGDAPNVVPAYAAGEFLVRSATMKAMNELVAKVRRIAEGAALMTGAELIFSFTDTASSDMITNRTLAKRIKRHLDQLGLIVPDARPEPPSGSSDWGNVSYQVPSVEIGYPIVRGDCAWHSPEVVAAADSDLAYHNAITVAKALALTGLDIVRDAAFRQTVSDEFAASARARVTE